MPAQLTSYGFCRRRRMILSHTAFCDAPSVISIAWDDALPPAARSRPPHRRHPLPSRSRRIIVAPRAAVSAAVATAYPARRPYKRDGVWVGNWSCKTPALLAGGPISPDCADHRPFRLSEQLSVMLTAGCHPPLRKASALRNRHPRFGAAPTANPVIHSVLRETSSRERKSKRCAAQTHSLKRSIKAIDNFY